MSVIKFPFLRRTRLVITVWTLLSVMGLAVLLLHETTPGSAGNPPQDWPCDAPFGGGDGIFMFAHPKCPCTRASLAELAKLITDFPGAVEAYVIFFQPDDRDSQWEDTDLWRTAREIPGVHVIADLGGRERKRFGVQTSGHVLLYSAGKLVFSGGITASRGHSGDNAGRDAIAELLRHGNPTTRESSVFGCPLCNRSSAE
jgi:hypothetical protein